ncbi:MAG: DUF4143 domain-containing protein [Flavobacteriia bacterium]
MRKIANKLNFILENNPVALVEGALNTGKSSFIKSQYPDFEYLSLKQKNLRKLILADPYRFFNAYLGKTIFDDIEEIPNFCDLIIQYSLSIYQTGNYILISNVKTECDSTFIKKCTFLPLDVSEQKFHKRFKLTLEANCLQSSLWEVKNYNSYLKRIFNESFSKLVRIQNQTLLFDLIQECTAYVDKPLNINAISKKIKVSQPTTAIWLDAFEKIGLIHYLKPLELDFNKRIIRSPKLYFSDCGLLAYLLNIKSPEKLLKSDYFFAIYSNFVFVEIYKKNETDLNPKNLFFWKESNGHEVKLLSENPTSFDIYEFISNHEGNLRSRKELDFFDEISDGIVLSKNIIYGGYKNYSKNEVNFISWQMI